MEWIIFIVRDHSFIAGDGGEGGGGCQRIFGEVTWFFKRTEESVGL